MRRNDWAHEKLETPGINLDEGKRSISGSACCHLVFFPLLFEGRRRWRPRETNVAATTGCRKSRNR